MRAPAAALASPSPAAALPFASPVAAPTLPVTPDAGTAARAGTADIGTGHAENVGTGVARNPDSSTPPSAAAAPSDQFLEDTTDIIEAPLDWQTFVPTDIADHLATMDRAARDSGCGVPWHLLAAIARVESDFGRNMSTSSAGALGYGQFLPHSWEVFGNEGNVYDYRDALPAIATYLCQSGLERDPRAALFAYNHADWYVDLVLNLAVRYDRMAPGAPTPGVLDVGPTAESSLPMHYAAGRDVRLQARRRTLEGQADWLGVPWRGRAPGASIAPAALETTTLAMVRGAFGLQTPPQPTAAAADGLTAFANRAWEGGLLPVPIEPPVSLPAPDDRRPHWLLAEIRRSISRAQPVVAVVAARALPGHSAEEGDQPIVIVGTTPTGLVYSDPSFSSSLGYGLELGEAEFLGAWQAASLPDRALALALRPGPLARDTHLHMAEPPAVSARVLPTPSLPTPEVAPAPLPLPTAAAQAAPLPTAGIAPAPAEAEIAPRAAAPAPVVAGDPSWLVVIGAGTSLALAWLISRLRAGRSP